MSASATALRLSDVTPTPRVLTESGRFVAVQYSCAYAIWRKQFLLKIRAKKNATEFPGAEDG